MRDPYPPELELDMTPDGGFREPPRPPLGMRVAAIAVVAAVLAGTLAVALLALWFALALIPVALVAAAVAWIAFRIQLWRLRRSGADTPAIWRP